MIKRCLVISLFLHLFCILCFSFSLSLNREFDIYSINFLGSILKEADFLFSPSKIRAISADALTLNIFLLPNQKKSIRLYSRDSNKPPLPLHHLLSEREHISQIYKRIDTKLGQGKDIKQVEIDIPEPNWEKIKLEIK